MSRDLDALTIDTRRGTAAPARLGARVLSEAVGTGLLVAAVIGSGIAAQRLSPDDTGLQLLENAIATGAVLTVLIVVLQPVSAAFNPVVTVLERLTHLINTRQAALTVVAQLLGGAAGAVLANLMFSESPITFASSERAGPGIWLAEVVATAGLVLTITALSRTGRPQHIGWAVGAYITAAYWFTSSTSFANPAVTIARTLSDTFAGISPGSVPAFLLCQAIGGALGYLTARTLYPHPKDHR
jgi:glycerol uptake facilitator-like aquaporin